MVTLALGAGDVDCSLLASLLGAIGVLCWLIVTPVLVVVERDASGCPSRRPLRGVYPS